MIYTHYILGILCCFYRRDQKYSSSINPDMDVPDSVPSLAKLTDINTQWSSLCHWHNKPNGRQGGQRCGNSTSMDDVQRRKILIQNLRNLISSGTTETNKASSTARSTSSPQIQEILKELSELLLCKRRHRDKSAAIYLKWSIELGEPRKSTSPPVTHDIRKELNIEDGKTLLCQGKTSKGIRCTKQISAQNRNRADAIIAALANVRDSSPATKENVIVLAQLLMCQGYHQDQAIRKSEEWFKKIQKLFPPADAAPSRPSNRDQPSTPPLSRTTTGNSETPRSTASSVFSRAGSIATSTPPTSPPSQRRYDTRATASESPLHSRSTNSTLPTSPPSQRRYNTRATASESPLHSRSTNNTTTTVDEDPQPVGHSRVTRKTAHTLPPKVALLKFKPFPPKGIKAIVTNIYERIKRSIIEREKDDGVVYGFQRDGDNLIKFGYTCKMGLEARMKAWNTRCRQEVKVVFHEYLPHAAKVESLVQAILYRERRREVLVNGLCNRGKGCSTVHEEWFEVTLERLVEVVELCKRWINTCPYENGILRTRWVEHIDKLYKAQSDPLLEDWRAWLDIAKFAKDTAVEETVPPKVKKQAGIIITETEIKSELDDTVLANVPRLRQELSKSSQRYVQRIKKLRDETREDKSPAEYTAVTQDLPLHLHDPFAASATTTTLPHASLRGSRKTEAL
jgi:hypothetical protein